MSFPTPPWSTPGDSKRTRASGETPEPVQNPELPAAEPVVEDFGRGAPAVSPAASGAPAPVPTTTFPPASPPVAPPGRVPVAAMNPHAPVEAPGAATPPPGLGQAAPSATAVAGVGAAPDVNRLLVVDDSPQICQFVARVARPLGFSVRAIHTVDEFEAAYRSFQPTLCMLDLQLGNNDGVEVINHMFERQYNVPIVLMSGFSGRVLESVGRLATSRGLEVIARLEKPLMLDPLRSLLVSQIQERPEDPLVDLKRGIEAGEIVPFYQPKIDLQSGRVVGVEALARWLHPKRGKVSPAEFIPLAESTDLIAPLTWSILNQSLRDNAAWRVGGMSLHVAVNVSAKMLTFGDFLSHLRTSVDESGVDPEDLVLEVTESAAMEDVTLALDVFARVRLRGIGLAIDDFGTGYSSLVWLQRMPFSELKVDQSFTREVLTSHDSRVITKTIIDMGHNLGLKVVAEGISDLEILKRVRELGADIGQGFAIGKPMANEDLINWVRNYSPMI